MRKSRSEEGGEFGLVRDKKKAGMTMDDMFRLGSVLTGLVSLVVATLILSPLSWVLRSTRDEWRVAIRIVVYMEITWVCMHQYIRTDIRPVRYGQRNSDR